VAAYLVEAAAPGLYALAVWDASWNSCNNCYLLREGGDGGRAILIDSGKLRDVKFRRPRAERHLAVVLATGAPPRRHPRWSRRPVGMSERGAPDKTARGAVFRGGAF